jgi:TonB-dependent receptor
MFDFGEGNLSRNQHSGSGRSRQLAILGTASSLVLAAMIATPAFAQDANPEEKTAEAESPAAEGEIIVTGYRASLKNAQDAKRRADTVVDVITAEDIGALPDRSVAEALQRVPGVNIGRFEKPTDPDRFSVEGTGVIIRGLPFVRSELNGRDIFSATGGRELSFNDLSPELLGRIEVFKNVTPDMIEGGIAGTVNLVTRKPLDTSGFMIAGTVEGNYGDLAKEWSPGFSGLISNSWDTGIGRFGIQFGYAQQELVTRTDASQLTDPCYRDALLGGPCLRVRSVSSGGFGNPSGYNATNFPPAGAVIVPKGAGVRTTELTRDRKAYSAAAQWESNDGRAKVTFEYLRAETEASINEHAVLAQVNDDGLFPRPRAGTTFTFDDSGHFTGGTLTQTIPYTPWQNGIPTEFLRFQRQEDATTEDFSFDLDLAPSDRLRFNFEVQHIKSDKNYDALISATQTFADIAISNATGTPSVQFLDPETGMASASFLSDPRRTYYWFLLDSAARNEGDLTSMRFDGEYDVSEDGFLKGVRFGARWSDRNRLTRDTNFGNWGNLGAPWAGRGGNWNCGDFQKYGCGGAYVADFPNSASSRNPFDGFQRGAVDAPLGGNPAHFFGSDNMLNDYLAGATETQARSITDYTLSPNAWRPIYSRQASLLDGTLVNCDPFCPSEITRAKESTQAGYVRLDFGSTLGGGIQVDGNIGVRYARTTIQTRGLLGFPDPQALGFPAGATITAADLQQRCASRPIDPNTGLPSAIPGLEYCQLSAPRLAQFAAGFTGTVVADQVSAKFANWLPSFNIRFDFGKGMILRGAVSKGISRPDQAAYRAGGGIGNNVAALVQGGTTATGPLFAINTGNPFLRPVESWNYDLSLEWYFSRVGSLTAAFFMKDVGKLINNGAEVRQYTDPDSGRTLDVEFRGPFNAAGGKLKGVELAYQQTYDFLPGILSGLGSQFSYTYVDAGDFENLNTGSAGAFANLQPLAGVSKHTANAVVFYEKGPVSARVAYNWRSAFLITPRDDIFPFSPIWQEAGGQLDASIFFTVNKHLKLGIQGVNLLDEVTNTSQVVDFDGTRYTRSAFRNDRRYTFLARFDF